MRKQRDKWVVRVDGIDTSTGNHRPSQLGTYPSQRSALAAARGVRATDLTTERGTVAWLVRRYVAGRTDTTEKAREQYAWAIPHIEADLGAISLSRLDRDDVAAWVDGIANGGTLSWRSVQICRNVRFAGTAANRPGQPTARLQSERTACSRRHTLIPPGARTQPLGPTTVHGATRRSR